MNDFHIKVLPKAECDRLFGPDEISNSGLPVFKLRRELPFGFQKDISCVGNEVGIRFGLTKKLKAISDFLSLPILTYNENGRASKC